MPKVSIITPCYNSQAFVGETIQSMREQTFQEWEHIIVDDGSSDASAQVIQSCLASDARMTLIRQANSGVCKTRNTGFAAASKESDYLCFLDADDCPDPEMLAVLAGYLDRNPEVGLAYCQYRCVNSESASIPTPYAARHVPAGIGVGRLPQNQARTPFLSIFCGAPVLPSSALIRRTVYERSPQWDEAFGQHHEELDLFLSIALLSEVHFISKPLLRYRQHPAQSTKNPGRFLEQQRKLDAKWQQRSGLTADQQIIVEAAWRFREGRMIPYSGLLAGTRHLRQGEAAQAARFYVGALRRYLRSFIPSPSRQPRRAAEGAL